MGGGQSLRPFHTRAGHNAHRIRCGRLLCNRCLYGRGSSRNQKLTNNNPVKLIWSNSQGIKFEKNISLDDQFLFTITEKVINSSDKTYNFYSYGQIIRNKKPEISGFYILHEGPIATLDEELIEEDYDDIEEKKFSRNATEGWLGIGDKYWVTSVIPPRNKGFKATFDYKVDFQ